MAIMFQLTRDGNRGMNNPAASTPYLVEFSGGANPPEESALLWRGSENWVILVEGGARPVCYLTGRRPIRVEEHVQPGQLVRLSNRGVTEADGPLDWERPQMVLAELSAATHRTQRPFAPWQLLTVGLLVGMLLTLVICLPFLGGDRGADTLAKAESGEKPAERLAAGGADNPTSTRSDSATQSSKTDLESNPPKPSGTSPVQPPPRIVTPAQPPRTVSPEQAPVNPTQSPPQPTAPLVNVEESVYAVMVEVEIEGQPKTFQLGTAWAVGDNQLVTAGSVASAVNSFADLAPKVTVYNPKTQQAARVTAAKTHPRYAELYGEFEKANKELDATLELLGIAGEDQGASREEALQAVQTANTRLRVVLEKMTQHDIGVLTVAQTLPTPLRWSPSSTAQVTTVGGVPMAVEGLDRPRQPENLTYRGVAGKFQATANPTTGGESLTVTFTAAAEDNLLWAGAPVLDAKGQVIAVYSGFIDSDPQTTQGPKTHNVVSTRLLTDFPR